MKELNTEIYTTYVEGYDRTIVWQEMYLGDEHLQTAIVGWYYGKPSDEATKRYSDSSIIAQYF